MGKAHRDNARARRKIGQVAYDKKAERRAPDSKCLMCGGKCRAAKLDEGWCPVCVGNFR